MILEKQDTFIDEQLVQDENKYIIFNLGEEIYAVKLLSVREVVEIPFIKPVPKSNHCFLGVCNIRGEIIGVIALNERFEIKIKQDAQPVLLVFKINNSILSVKIDKLISVNIIHDENIDKNVNISSLIPKEYIIGIGKLGDKLVTIIELNKLLSLEEIVDIEKLN